MANRDVKRLGKDLKEFGVSAAGNLPGIGPVIGMYDTYNKARRVVKSAKRVYRRVKRQYLS